MIELIDCHTHTVLSGHGVGTVDDVVRAAVEQGISTIALTEHLALPSFMDSKRQLSMDPGALAGYRSEIEAAREKYPHIEIVAGLEVDWIEGNEEYIRADLTGFTHLLGSVHFIDGWAFDDPDSLDEWSNRDIDEVWTKYFELWCDAVRGDIPFNVMTHPDLPKKFGHRPSFDTRELYEHVASVAAARGVAIEVNTAGLRKPVCEIYPCESLLCAFQRAGVDATVGSDAHAPLEVGLGILDAYDTLRCSGYTHVMAPTPSGGRRYIQL